MAAASLTTICRLGFNDLYLFFKRLVGIELLSYLIDIVGTVIVHFTERTKTLIVSIK